MRKILILLAHPAMERSRTNRFLADAVKDLPGVTLHDLYEAYPDFNIDVKHEQSLLGRHDALVFQHPLHWYSTPALLKEWQDLVLEHRWAYGRDGTALKGKIVIHVVSTGGGLAAYEPGGFHGHTVREFLLPLERTAGMCGMVFLAPFIVHGALGVERPEHIEQHARSYRALLEALRDDRLDIAKACEARRVNDNLEGLIISKGIAR